MFQILLGHAILKNVKTDQHIKPNIRINIYSKPMYQIIWMRLLSLKSKQESFFQDFSLD